MHVYSHSYELYTLYIAFFLMCNAPSCLHDLLCIFVTVVLTFVFLFFSDCMYGVRKVACCRIHRIGLWLLSSLCRPAKAAPPCTLILYESHLLLLELCLNIVVQKQYKINFLAKFEPLSVIVDAL